MGVITKPGLHYTEYALSDMRFVRTKCSLLVEGCQIHQLGPLIDPTIFSTFAARIRNLLFIPRAGIQPKLESGS